MSDHEPSVPEWTCRECGADWPCITRREEISDAFADQYTSMVMYLAYTMIQAAEDLRHVPAGWLHNRFVGWTNDPDDPVPFTSIDILINGYKLANDHSPDADGKCPVCGDSADCWVSINPDGPGFLIPVP